MKQTAFVCVVVIAFGAGTACITTKQGYIAKGNKFYDAGKYADADLNYRKAIQKDPKFGEAYYRLGLAAVKENQAKEAYDALYRAVQLLPDRTDVNEKFADVCLSFYLALPSHPQILYQQLTQLSGDLLSKNANSYEGLMIKGYLASSDRKPADAIKFFQRALQINASNPGVTTELVRVLIQNGQVQEGEKLAKELIDRQKDYGAAYDALYDFYATHQRMADAENILKAKVRNNPKEPEYILQLARHYAGLQKSAEVAPTLQRMVENGIPDARLRIGDFYVGQKNYAEALRYYQDGAAQRGTDQLVYRKRTAVTLLAEGKKDEAFQQITRLLKENPTDDDLLHLHADLLIGTEKPENAVAALQDLETLLKEHPGDASLKVQLGRAYREKGDLRAARNQLQSALDQRKDLVAARYELAEIALAQARPEEAIRQANEALKLNPKDGRARLLRARGMMMTSGSFDAARTELTDLVKDSPRYTEAQLQFGLLLTMENKYPQAIEVFNKLRDSGDPRAYAGLAAAYSLQRQGDKAQEVLKEGLKKWPDSPVLLEQLAGAQAIAGHYDLAIAQFRDILAKDPKSVSARRHLGEIYESRGDHANAILQYQQAYELAPNDVNIAMILAAGLSRAGRTTEAKKQYEAITEAYPDNTGAMNNLAFLLADTGGDLDQALRLVQRALAKMPNQPAYSDTLGYVYLRKGLNSSALQTFKLLVNKYPIAAFRYHYGLALYEKGDKAGAKKELETALNEHPTQQDKIKIRQLLDKIS
jgi:tetratricopeptide (TPR) repeat protein